MRDHFSAYVEYIPKYAWWLIWLETNYSDTTQITFLPKEVVSCYKRNGLSVYCCFLDSSMVFDRVRTITNYLRFYPSGVYHIFTSPLYVSSPEYSKCAYPEADACLADFISRMEKAGLTYFTFAFLCIHWWPLERNPIQRSWLSYGLSRQKYNVACWWPSTAQFLLEKFPTAGGCSCGIRRKTWYQVQSLKSVSRLMLPGISCKFKGTSWQNKYLFHYPRVGCQVKYLGHISINRTIQLIIKTSIYPSGELSGRVGDGTALASLSGTFCSQLYGVEL